jgi:DNA-binding IscR family transcriptional regulator
VRTDTRLSRVLHVLMHMARSGGPLTSEHMAKMLGTNPVVVRRMMAAVRETGYVRAEKGPGGGWTMACDPSTTTLRDLYRAVGSPTLFAIGSDDPNPACAVERVVHEALGDAVSSAEELLLTRLGQVTLADLAAAFDALLRKGEGRRPRPRRLIRGSALCQHEE